MNPDADLYYPERKVHIIGQGLAGSVLAFLLKDAAFDVVIHDDGHLSSSSVIAAGMWNPLSFKKLHASWLAEQLIPAAFRIYQSLEKKLNTAFFHPVDLVRIFPDIRGANEWDERSVHPEIKPFAGKPQDELTQKYFHAPFGTGTVKQAGWLHTRIFLESSRSYFVDSNSLVEQKVNAAMIEQWIAQGDVVIQCTGSNLIAEAPFAWLPVLKNKGEVLTINIKDMPDVEMYNFGKFIIPVGDGVFRLGATYELNPIHLDPTETAHNELTGDLQAHLLQPFDVLKHETGYRPTVPDRKPVIGFDPQYPLAGVFNGFGSKGVLLIPFFAEMLLNHMQHGSEIHREVNYTRYTNRFRK
jgi:glycine oxidase